MGLICKDVSSPNPFCNIKRMAVKVVIRENMKDMTVSLNSSKVSILEVPVKTIVFLGSPFVIPDSWE